MFNTNARLQMQFAQLLNLARRSISGAYILVLKRIHNNVCCIVLKPGAFMIRLPYTYIIPHCNGLHPHSTSNITLPGNTHLASQHSMLLRCPCENHRRLGWSDTRVTLMSTLQDPACKLLQRRTGSFTASLPHQTLEQRPRAIH